MSRRECSQKSSAREVIEKLRAARDGGIGHRLSQLESELADPGYDVLTENAYTERTAKEAEAAKAFLVDDEGIGYLDENEKPRPRRQKRPPPEKKASVAKKPTLPKKEKEKKTLLDAWSQSTKRGGLKEETSSDALLHQIMDEIEKGEVAERQTTVASIDVPSQATSVHDASDARAREDATKERPSVKQQPLSEIKTADRQANTVHTTNTVHTVSLAEMPNPEIDDVLSAAHLTTDDAWKTEGVNDLESNAAFSASMSNVPSAPMDGMTQELMKTQDGSVPFYFMEAEENNDHPGLVYFFGKVIKASNHTLSCCLRFKDPERAVYFVPHSSLFADATEELRQLQEQAKAVRDPKKRPKIPSYVEERTIPLKAEVEQLLKTRGIKGHIKMKMVRRNYAFDYPSIPHGPQYVLKVMFSAKGKGNPLPLTLQGEHFQAVMATRQSLLESILLKKRIMGPSWIALDAPTIIPKEQQRSWCALELEVLSHKSLDARHKEVLNRDIPLLRIAALQFKSLPDPQMHRHDIHMVTMMGLNGVPYDRTMKQWEWSHPKMLRQFHIIAKYNKEPWPPGFEAEIVQKNKEEMQKPYSSGEVIYLHDSKRGLLEFFLQKLQEMDPDVLVGHEISSVDLGSLMRSMKENKVVDWSRLGRLKRKSIPSEKGNGGKHASVVCGRLLCDTYFLAKEYLSQVDFTLTTLAENQLDTVRTEMKMEHIQDAYRNKKKLQDCLQHSRSDCALTLKLMFHLTLLPLTKQLSNLSGSLWNRTLSGQRAQRIDMLLLHSFHDRKFMLPEKRPGSNSRLLDIDGHHKGPQYSGGLVLDPKIGLYDSMVLVLDFNSLYPSIIMEYKLCFTTVDRSGSEPLLPGSSAPDDAPLPMVIQRLIESRRQVKQLIAKEKDPLLLQQRKTREKALKLTANSMYGCLGYTASRFYCQPLAELVTSRGRELLQKTVNIVEHQLEYEVIYGDTDSIMVHTGSHEYNRVRRDIGEGIKRTINKDYKYIKIDIDGIYKPMLLIKKKKYAAIKLEVQGNQLVKQREEKGLDIVRRDWSGLAKQVGCDVLDAILSGRPAEDVAATVHLKLKEAREKVERGDFKLSDYVIVKELSKHPEEYRESHNQPHVSVALRRKQQGHKDSVQAGQTVPYVICLPREGRERSQAECAYHLDEVQNTAGLKIDARFYLEQQVYAVVSRLCEPVQGIDTQSLAMALGLDAMKYKPKNPSFNFSHKSSVSNPFHNCQPLLLTAGNHSFPFCGVGAVVNGETSMKAALMPPEETTTTQSLTLGRITNQAILQTRRHIIDYYDAPCRAEEEEERTTRIPRYAEVETSTKWTRTLSEKQLYYQLKFLMEQLNVDSAITRVKKPEEVKAAKTQHSRLKTLLDPVYQSIRKLNDTCHYATVNIAHILRP